MKTRQFWSFFGGFVSLPRKAATDDDRSTDPCETVMVLNDMIQGDSEAPRFEVKGCPPSKRKAPKVFKLRRKQMKNSESCNIQNAGEDVGYAGT
ncbi:hypothetical protein QJS10_CPA03g00886 [Acorus calamus]|uniref:Uncharacterized protein n=1 Tax=Acorus calamus TaxID=4465 RepID=A0AAV9F8D9_ACOCL|nr:hypothetical protein QJS10_CPA03g00886 [Acorus calamus]